MSARFIVKTKALMISCAITVQQTWAFAFIYAKRRFSHDTAQIYISLDILFSLQMCVADTQN